MILACDIGNTTIGIGSFDGVRVIGSRAVSVAGAISRDALRANIESSVRELLGSNASFSRAVIGSVVPEQTDIVRAVIDPVVNHDTVVVNAALPLGMKLNVTAPEQVGADRIANAVAAKAVFGAPAIVVDLGTATTIDVVDRQGDFIGGVIATGISTGFEGLVDRAALLRGLEMVRPRTVIGRNTVEALSSGAVIGHAAMIDGVVTRIERELGYRARCFLTGGAAKFILNFLTVPFEAVPHLTLQGLACIAQLSSPEEQ